MKISEKPPNVDKDGHFMHRNCEMPHWEAGLVSSYAQTHILKGVLTPLYKESIAEP